MLAPPRQRSWVQKAFRPSVNNIGQRVITGAAFTFFGIALRLGITVGSMAVLARLLTPTDFGHVAMATVITELAAVFSNFGFGSILIQRTSISRIQIDTMHWCAIGLGVILTSVVFGLSFFASHVFQDDMVGPLLKVLCLIFILEELTMVPRSLFSRRMLFQQDFFIQSGILLARTGTAITMALSGLGVWSLVGGALTGVALYALAYSVISGYVPRLKFSVSFLQSTWRTNGGYFGNGILFYVNANVDFFLVGRMLGASLLGQYQNARSLTDEIRVRMVQPLQRVLFPAFSAMQNDPDRFRDGILRSSRLLALAFTPVGVGVAAVAPELVRVLYGVQWLPMIPILQVISLATGLGAAGSVGSSIFNATNRVGLSFKIFAISTSLSVAFLLFGSQWGLMGVAWSRLALAGVGVVTFRISLGLVQMGFRHLWQILGTPFIAAGAMWLLIASSRHFIQTWVISISAQLGCLVAIGMLFYVATSLLISPHHVDDAKEVFYKLKRHT
ncbi:MAG: lipopolysaccharide biosynthesis protein [Rhodoferax sp.]|uniref:lipopolysaccharide biosynthesis protein n=1 Tax=Rhodoferax sp. TaxID=50421 RepID=UPI0013FFF5DE|nr:lipopolysaccharide biosynthesis protein [Rhodoferax sp.]NDP38245.1 lipopolysaccharide biosynthesis protein [Rhodoferax sp.]